MWRKLFSEVRHSAGKWREFGVWKMWHIPTIVSIPSCTPTNFIPRARNYPVLCVATILPAQHPLSSRRLRRMSMFTQQKERGETHTCAYSRSRMQREVRGFSLSAFSDTLILYSSSYCSLSRLFGLSFSQVSCILRRIVIQSFYIISSFSQKNLFSC